VINTAEARALAEGNPRASCTSRAPRSISPRASTSTTTRSTRRAREPRGAHRGRRPRADPEPRLYVYAQKHGRAPPGRRRRLRLGRRVRPRHIKKHEKTRADKEDDRTRHIDALARARRARVPHVPRGRGDRRRRGRKREGSRCPSTTSRRPTACSTALGARPRDHGRARERSSRRADALRRRRPPPQRRRVARAQGAAATGPSTTLPRGALPPRSDEDPGVQPRRPRPRGPLARGAPRGARERASTSSPRRRRAAPDAPKTFGRVRGRQVVPARVRPGSYDASDPVKPPRLLHLPGPDPRTRSSA
jgi:hypothetical protein